MTPTDTRQDFEKEMTMEMIAGIEGKHLAFRMGLEEYAVPVNRICEIIETSTLGESDSSLPHIRGKVKANGKEITVFDLRRRFGMEERENEGKVCVITVMTQGWNGPRVIGIAVDGITSFIHVESSQMEAVPPTEDVREGVLLGVVQGEDWPVLLMDVDRVANEDEFTEKTG